MMNKHFNKYLVDVRERSNTKLCHVEIDKFTFDVIVEAINHWIELESEWQSFIETGESTEEQHMAIVFNDMERWQRESSGQYVINKIKRAVEANRRSKPES